MFVMSIVKKDQLGVVNVKFEFSGILKREGNKKIRSSLFMVAILVGMQKKHAMNCGPQNHLCRIYLSFLQAKIERLKEE